jgi:hypothetical protein
MPNGVWGEARRQILKHVVPVHPVRELRAPCTPLLSSRMVASTEVASRAAASRKAALIEATSRAAASKKAP